MTRARRTQTDFERRVAAEIRAEIARQGLKQNAIAKRLGRSGQWLSYRLSGQSALTVHDVELIAAALGVPATKFLAPPASWPPAAPAPDPPAVMAYVPMYQPVPAGRAA